MLSEEIRELRRILRYRNHIVRTEQKYKGSALESGNISQEILQATR
jgi:hypothetical protein